MGLYNFYCTYTWVVYFINFDNHYINYNYILLYRYTVTINYILIFFLIFFRLTLGSATGDAACPLGQTLCVAKCFFTLDRWAKGTVSQEKCQLVIFFT